MRSSSSSLNTRNGCERFARWKKESRAFIKVTIKIDVKIRIRFRDYRNMWIGLVIRKCGLFKTELYTKVYRNVRRALSSLHIVSDTNVVQCSHDEADLTRGIRRYCRDRVRRDGERSFAVFVCAPHLRQALPHRGGLTSDNSVRFQRSRQ